MNFVYISPNYPEIYGKFCHELAKLGVNTLGIGDGHYHSLTNELRASLSEYYKVSSLDKTSEICDAMNHFIAKYGKIDGLESNNEYWLESDSLLREYYNIDGIKQTTIADYKHKSRMKSYFTLADVRVAPYVVTRDINEVLSFASIEGFPLFAKPNNGVGANGIKKINDVDDLLTFFESYPSCDYIFETYIEGNLFSYDGITDSFGNIIFETCHHFTTPIDILVQSGAECIYRTLPEIPEKLKIAGRNSVRVFNLKNRFFHIEFFELTKSIHGCAEKGDFIGLEANMRIAGGLTPDMINVAHDINVYEIWAKCMTTKENIQPITFTGSKYCTNTARIKNIEYVYTTAEIAQKFKDNFVKAEITCLDYTPFGNEEFLAIFSTLEECLVFEKAVSMRKSIT